VEAVEAEVVFVVLRGNVSKLRFEVKMLELEIEERGEAEEEEEERSSSEGAGMMVWMKAGRSNEGW